MCNSFSRTQRCSYMPRTQYKERDIYSKREGNCQYLQPCLSPPQISPKKRLSQLPHSLWRWQLLGSHFPLYLAICLVNKTYCRIGEGCRPMCRIGEGCRGVGTWVIHGTYRGKCRGAQCAKRQNLFVLGLIVLSVCVNKPYERPPTSSLLLFKLLSCSTLRGSN